MDDRSRRIVLQHLDSLARAGLTHLPVATTANIEMRPARVAPIELRPSPVAAVREPVPEASRIVMPPKPIDAPAVTVSPKPSPPAARPADRVAALKILEDQVAACTRCPVLVANRSRTVFGVGNPHARIVFVGEAPGADEDRKGEPFVGRAGQLLNDIIRSMRLTRDEIYICNILKCRPPDNRTPEDLECGNCREYLLGQLEIIDPDYIVCWGAVAARNIVNSTVSIGKLRGRFFEFGRAKVLCTYHPSYLLRTPSAKKDVWADMKFFMADMGVDLTKQPS